MFILVFKGKHLPLVVICITSERMVLNFKNPRGGTFDFTGCEARSVIYIYTYVVSTATKNKYDHQRNKKEQVNKFHKKM